MTTVHLSCSKACMMVTTATCGISCLLVWLNAGEHVVVLLDVNERRKC